jgi:hypothetical protein
VLPQEPSFSEQPELPPQPESSSKEDTSTVETKKPIERPTPRSGWTPKTNVTSTSSSRGRYSRDRPHRTPGPPRGIPSGPSRSPGVSNYVYRKKPGIATPVGGTQANSQEQSSPFDAPDGSSQGASLSSISSRLSTLSFDWPFSPPSASQSTTS